MQMKIKWLASCLVVGVAPCLFGQTAFDLNAKYPVVNAYEVRPGILLTAKYAEDGQVCEMTLEKRHQTPGRVDLDSTIPHELVKELVEELVPVSERGKPANQFTEKWGYITSISGSLAVSEAQFENVSIEIDGSVSGSSSAGDEVVIIRWKKRACAVPKQARDTAEGKGRAEAGKEAAAGGSPEGDGTSAPVGEFFAGFDDSVVHGATMTDEITGRDKARDAAGRSGPKAQQGQGPGYAHN